MTTQATAAASNTGRCTDKTIEVAARADWVSDYKTRCLQTLFCGFNMKEREKEEVKEEPDGDISERLLHLQRYQRDPLIN